MRILLVLLLAVCLLTAAPLAAQEPTGTPAVNAAPYRINGYFASWAIYDRQYFVTNIPADKLTDLTYAFAAVSDSDEITFLDQWADTEYPYPGDKDSALLKGNFHQLQILKAAHPQLQTLISIGGWTGSAKFSDVALTQASRDKFASSVVAFVTKYGFDGVDIDWEYPTGDGDPGNVTRPEDKDNFVLMLADLRSQLDAQGAKDSHHYLLTIALSADKGDYTPLDWTKITPLLDWINVMTYDMAGDWSDVTGFNSPLYGTSSELSVDATISGLLALGVPANKLLLGAPFYGRGWSGAGSQNSGLNQPYKSIPQGTSEQGSYDYWDLAAHYIGKYQRFWSEAAQVPWLYDAKSGTMISYDDPQSLAGKAEYVRGQGLGGMMVWELSEDTPDSALLTAIYNKLSAP